MTWKFQDKNAPTWNNGHPLSVYFWVAGTFSYVKLNFNQNLDFYL